MTAFTMQIHLSADSAVELAPSRNGGCRNVIGPCPSIALDETICNLWC